jgi:hypothetical protein
MTTLVHADPVNAVLAELAGCLCNEIDKTPDPVCFCGVVPGSIAAWDYVDSCDEACGMAWVRLVDVVPANGLGVPNTNAGNCGSALGIDVEVGLVRCFEIPADGQAPTVEQMLSAAVQQSADMLTMRRAISCCSSSKEFVVDGYVPVGPQGAVVGGIWNLSMMVY